MYVNSDIGYYTTPLGKKKSLGSLQYSQPVVPYISPYVQGSGVKTLTKVIPTNPVPTTTVFVDDRRLEDIHRKYEEESRFARFKYESEVDNRIMLTDKIAQLEDIIESERLRFIDLENRYISLEEKYNNLVVNFDSEVALRMDLEKKLALYNEELRRDDLIIKDLENLKGKLENDIVILENDNVRLRDDLAALTDNYNIRLREIEDRYTIKVRELNAQIESLRFQIERLTADYVSQINNLNIEWDDKLRRLEEINKNLSRENADLVKDIGVLETAIPRIRQEYEEEIRHLAPVIREEEYAKYQGIISGLEGKLAGTDTTINSLTIKNQDLIRELQLRDKQLYDLELRYESEIGKLRNEIADLRNQLAISASTIDKFRTDVMNKEAIIARLEGERLSFERELQRIRDVHQQEINKLLRDHEYALRKWEEIDRNWSLKFGDLERALKLAEEDAAKYKIEFERAREMVRGNVNRIISQTFGQAETYGRIFPL